MDFETKFKLKYVNVGVDVNLYAQQPLEVAKEGDVDRYLSRYCDPENPLTLSPSAINRYVACPMRFYFQHVAKVNNSDSLSEDVDNSMFGNIFHEAIDHIYKPLIGLTDISSRLDALRCDRSYIERVVIGAMRDVCKIRESLSDDALSGDLLLIKDIVVKYIIDGVLSYDASNSDFEIVGTEQKYKYPLLLPSGKVINIEGTLDRVDRLKSGRLRVIDYKTGGKHLEFKSIRDLFEGEGVDRQGHIIQTLTYSMMLHRSLGESVVPSLYYVRFMHTPGYSPLLVDKSDDVIASYQAKSEAFEEHLTLKLEELFDRSIPFRQTDDTAGTCTYCDFRSICRV